MKNCVKLLLLAAAFQSLTASADIPLKDNSELIGKWNLYAEAAKVDGEKKAVKVEWEFQKDGTLVTTATDSVGRTKEMKIAIKYAVENGELKKQATPGREKYESCKVVEKEGSNMVLKCTYLYFFLTKL